MNVLVIGAGKVGLPMASYLSEVGHSVRVYDSNEQLIRRLLQGDNILIWEPEIRLEKLKFYSNLGTALDGVDLVYVIVPTPTEQDSTRLSADAVISVRDEIRAHKWRGLIVVGSTLDPRTITHVFTDSNMAYNPPLIRLGHVVEDLRDAPLHLFGWDHKGYFPHIPEAFRALWNGSHTRDFWLSRNIEGDVMSIAIAKLAVNTTLSLKIAWANEIADVVRDFGGSVDTVFQALHSEPRIGPEYFTPGFAASGPCLVRDLSAWSDFAKKSYLSPALISSNAESRQQFVNRVVDLVFSVTSPRVAVLGITYKPMALDITKSKGIAIAKALVGHGIDVVLYDPAQSWFQKEIEMFSIAESAEDAISDANVVVRATSWPQFKGLDYGSKIVVDVEGVK